MRLLASLVVACFVALSHPVSFAQQTSPGSASGTVVDPAGSPVPGATLELLRGATVIAKTVSDGNGAWTFEKLAPGEYQIRVTLAGFATTVVSLRIEGVDAHLRIPLKVGQLAETVTITSSSDELAARNLSISGKAAGGGAGRGTGAAIAGGVPGGVVGGVVGGLPNAPPPPAAQPEQLKYFREGLMPDPYIRYPAPQETAGYAPIQENRFREVTEHPLSTFSIDVDTASYANVRRFLNEGRLPPPDAVRIEELINYFKYDYPAPRNGAPVSVTTEIAATPWNPETRLALIGLRTTPIRQERTPPRNLTFLLDVSGSMTPPNRLPLVKTAMKMLVDTLRPEDRVAIVVYAGASGLVLKPTTGAEKAEIHAAIDRLQSGGSTNGGAGTQLAYELASDHFVKGGINRVILATDGDFNVGITSRDELTRLIEEKRTRGIFLSVLGVGDNNLQDATMEMLADKGNGNYSYLDSIQEARRVLIAEAGATLVTVAKDVKLQIEFNPHFVAAYRLIGYENRVLRKEDFNNDQKDAGEMGAGHSVTALYEIVPAGQSVPGGVDPLKYQVPAKPPSATSPVNTTEMMNIRIRYKAPDGNTSRLLEFPVRNTNGRMTPNLGFASAVAEFGLLLRRSVYRASASWAHLVALAKEHRGSDPDGYRAEFIRLIDVAAALDGRKPTTDPALGTRR
jgi:Ca-activated chloride channel family protein